MALKDLYRDELAKREAAKKARCASFEEAKAALKTLYRSIADDRELMDQLLAEVELLDDDLRIDNGPIMIVVTAMPNGDIRLEYEVKRSDDYQSTLVPEVRTVDDAERVIARLLAEHPRDE